MIDFSNGKFSEKALDFLKNSDARLNICHGSVRSSKTVNCTLRWISYCLDGPPGDLLMVGRTIASLQRNVLNDLQDILGNKYFKWVNRQQGELKILDRRVHIIGAASEDAEARIRGATLAGAYCDEANLYPQSFWNQLMARCSVKGAKIFANCNPDSPYHWFYTEVIMNKNITNKKIWHFTLDDNPNLDDEYKDSLKAMFSGVFYKRFILGLWVVADGMIYDMFDEAKHMVDYPTVKHLMSNPATRYVIGCDYGTSTVMSWSLIAYAPGTPKIKIAEYYYDSRKTRKQKTDGEFADEFESWIQNNLGNANKIEAIYCDPSAASWKAELTRRGFAVRNANNDVIDGIRFVSSLLAKEEYLMSDTCKNTRDEYGSYHWDSAAQMRGVDKPTKENDHACDSDRYALYTHFKDTLTGTYSMKS